ncbi:hypothetical protein BJ165DRAFT_1499820 [Panaeolus papilionaceus]|nr:hypothetical protein BJ165DRAFT_1499820 [Panaeolus papilionaceus]
MTSMDLASLTESSLATAAQHLNVGRYFQGAAYVMLVYDHLLTLQDEVEHIWKKKLTLGTILFLLNRYGALFSVIIVIIAYNDQSWGEKSCHNFVIYEAAVVIALVGICELIMILRVYALYECSKTMLSVLLSMLLGHIVVTIVAARKGFALPLPPGLTACILSGSSFIFASFWIIPLIMDSTMFGLTMWRGRGYFRARSFTSRVMHILLRDGAIYFFAIFSANIIGFLIFMLSPVDLKYIGATFGQCITSVMVSRLMMNLKSAAVNPPLEQQIWDLNHNDRAHYLDL